MHISVKQKKIAYVLYLMAAAVLFLFWLFPEDSARDLAERGAKRINANINASIGDVSLLFPPGVKLKKVALSYKDAPVANADYLQLKPSLFALFGRSPRFDVKAAVFGGLLDGNCRISKGRSTQADVRMSGLKLESIAFLNALSGQRITGRMDGHLKAEAGGPELKTDSDIVLSDLTVAFAAPVLGMQSLHFDRVEAGLSSTQRRIEIKACSLKGPEVEGEFRGSILITQPYQKSVLNLSGFLKPQASFMKQAGKTLPIDMFMKKGQGEKGLPVRLSGTLQNPQFGIP